MQTQTKVLIGVGIAGIVGYVIYQNKAKGQKPSNQVSLPPITNQTPADDTERKAMYDDILKTLADIYLRMQESINPEQDAKLSLRKANIQASEHFNCIINDLKNMPKKDLLVLQDYLKNGEPEDIFKYNELRNISIKYDKAFEDKPCNNICVREDGSKYSSALPCGEKTGGTSIGIRTSPQIEFGFD
jgi:hypothetical protein